MVNPVMVSHILNKCRSGMRENMTFKIPVYVESPVVSSVEVTVKVVFMSAVDAGPETYSLHYMDENDKLSFVGLWDYNEDMTDLAHLIIATVGGVDRIDWSVLDLA